MRVDYVKANWSLEYDRAQDLGKVWLETFDGPNYATVETKSAHVKSVRRNSDGTFLFVFEAWGPNAANVEQLSWKLWAPHIERMDVRDELTLTRDGVDRLYQHLRNHKAGSKNVTMYDSRARSKRQGRDSGGYGIGIGSHKSDLRTTLYVRGHQSGAYEFQCAGAKLESKISAVNLMADSPNANQNMSLWYQVTLALWAMGWGDVQKTFGLSKEQIESLAAGDDVQTLTVEGQLAAVDSLLDSLPKDALMSVVESVQLRLM